jgi:hypothetical protein
LSICAILLPSFCKSRVPSLTNWQSLQHSSSSCDQEKEEKQEDFLNCLPLTNLTNKFERMSVKVDEGSEKNDDNQFNEGNKMVDRQEEIFFGEDDNIDKGESFDFSF